MKKILVIQTAFIGDVILATGIIEKLHSTYPEYDLHFLLRKGNESLLVKHPFLKKIWIWDKRKSKTQNLLRLIKEIRKERFDIVINLQRFASSGLLTAFSKAGERIGFNKNPLSFMFNKSLPHKIDGSSHEIDRNHSLISAITDSTASNPKLYPSEEDFALVNNFTSGKFVTIAPASVWFTKALPSRKWLELIQQVPKDYEIFLLGSKQDSTLCDSVIGSTDRNGMKNLAGKLSLLQSAALMSKAIMNYTNDSAPLHLASAVNAPVTAVFCSTTPLFGFGPLSDNSHILEIGQDLSCRPCGLHGKSACPTKHFNCAHKIKMEHYE